MIILNYLLHKKIGQLDTKAVLSGVDSTEYFVHLKIDLNLKKSNSKLLLRV